MGDHRSHLLFESAIERSSQLLGEGTEGVSLFLQLLQLIARNTLRREIGHAMLKLVAEHGEAIIDPLAEPVIVGTQDDGRHDTAPCGPNLCAGDLHQFIEALLHRIDPTAEVPGRPGSNNSAELQSEIQSLMRISY